VFGEEKTMVRTTLAFALTLGLAASACSGSLEDMRAAEQADALGADGFYFEHLDLKDTCHAFDSLLLKVDGGYVAVLEDNAETGTYELSDTELQLQPVAGDARTYELAIDDGSITLTLAGCKEVLVEAEPPTKPTKPTNPESDPACAERTGGALVTFTVGHDDPETLRLWITNAEFIARAKELVAKSDEPESEEPVFHPTPMFDKVIARYDACSGRPWSVDPERVSFGDVATEVCDAMPADLDADPDAWAAKPGNYCPWGPIVLSVDER
jgi:hypothetical protein